MDKSKRFTAGTALTTVTKVSGESEARPSRIITCHVNMSGSEIRAHVKSLVRKLKAKNGGKKLRLHSL